VNPEALDVVKEVGAVIGSLGVIVAAVVAFIRLIRRPYVRFKRDLQDAMASLRQLDGMILTVERIQQHIATIEAENRALADSDPTVARFSCGQGGENEYVNATYCRWLGVAGRADLLGWRWLSFVPEFDRDRLRDEWAMARKERRIYRTRHAMQALCGKVFFVDTVVTPVPDEGTVHRWIGVMRRVERVESVDDAEATG
jgi:PAS domain S-box-containing protein